MPLPRLLPLSALVLLGGCVYHVREQVDAVQCNLSLQPYDLAPPGQAEPPKPIPAPTDKGQGNSAPSAPKDVQTTALMQGAQPDKPGGPKPTPGERLTIPRDVPASETPLINLKDLTDEEKRAYIKKLYPELPPLPEVPAAQPGPGGKPYTLAQLQELAATYSPTLKQAASDVEAARGNLIQARAYPNPTVGYEADPTSLGLSTNFQGFFIDQPIKMGGKLKLQESAARMDLFNAELALRRARSDLSTQVRNAYFNLLVARETVRVNRALARLTDEVYRVQVDISLTRVLGAAYEPAALRSQAYAARLALEQSIKTYTYAWQQLVAAVGLRGRDIPLSEVAGRIDSFVPRYDYEGVLAHVVTRHTDVLTARNTIEKARYNLKLAQVTPWMQDLDVQVKVQRDFSVPPGQVVSSVTMGMPLSVWDQNKGNIIAAESALVRALEQPHAAELTLTNNLLTAFVGYKNNLRALEDYRDRILPDQVRAYRGVLDRRFIAGDFGGTAFSDVVTAQQALATGVATYLTLLGQLWTSVVSVADLMQTDDLFQLGTPEALPPLPDLDHLPPLPCGHGCPPPGALPGKDEG